MAVNFMKLVCLLNKLEVTEICSIKVHKIKKKTRSKRRKESSGSESEFIDEEFSDS